MITTPDDATRVSIERYLAGGMSEEEAAAFLASLSRSPEGLAYLGEALEQQALLFDILRKKARKKRKDKLMRHVGLPGRHARRGVHRPARRPGAWAVWVSLAACVAMAAGAYLYFGSRRFEPQMRLPVAHVLAASPGVSVHRGGEKLPARIAMSLLAGDRVVVESGAVATLAYANESTRVKLASGSELVLPAGDRGKRLEVLTGKIEASVAKQPEGRPMVITTKDAKAEVLGTKLALEVAGGSTRLEVREGRVRLTNTHSGESIEVRGGFCAVAAVGVALAAEPLSTDWPQLGRNPQHTGYSPENLTPPFVKKWTLDFPPDKLYATVTPVVVEDRVFIGTKRGHFYALDAADGHRLWKFPAADDAHVGPIVGTAGVEGGKVFLASMDGCIYALDAPSGAELWKFDAQHPKMTGFSTSVLLAEGKVFTANRGGRFYCLDQGNGQIVWTKDFPAALLQAPAYNDGRVHLACMDMRLYALDAQNGGEVWKTGPADAVAFKDYWPVVHKGYVIVRPMARGGQKRTLVFNETTGAPVDMDIPSGAVMNGAASPPAVDAQGRLITGSSLPAGAYGSGWARYDMDTGQSEMLSTDKEGRGNSDENMTVTVGGGIAYILHLQEANAQYTGWCDLATKTWGKISGGLIGGNMTGNTQGGGASQGVIAGGALYHVVNKVRLTCRVPQ